MTPRGFTLIELLVVVGIMAALAAPLSVVLRLAQRAGHRTQAQAVLRRVDAAVRLFREDIGAYPWQDHPSGTLEANRLGLRLAHVMTAAERGRLAADLDAAARAYACGGSHRLDAADIDPAASIYDPYKSSNQTDVTDADRAAAKGSHAAIVNRLAGERARLAILAGDVAVAGIGANAGRSVIAATSDGWCDDYLAGDMARRELSADGAAILDPLGEPIRYICPVTPGVAGFWPSKPMQAVHGGNVSIPVRAAAYGLDARSRRSPTTSLDSDRSDHAPARMLLEPELWSAGEDRLIADHRNAAENRDDVPAAPYDKDLQ